MALILYPFQYLMNSEVLIIGGGVIGLTIARELHKKGVRQITVVDRSTVGGEASWAAAGMLAPNIETDSTADFHRFGIESLGLYPELNAALLDETGVDIELDRSGTLCLAFDETEESELSKTFEMQTVRGVAVEQITGDHVRELEAAVSPATRAALLYPNDWQVDNRKLLSALQKFADTAGVRIVDNVEVSELITVGRLVTGARTAAGEITSDFTVLATGAWTSLIKIGGSKLQIDVRPVRGQMICFKTPTRELRRVVYSRRGYLVPRADGRILVGATVEDAGFDKSTTAEGIDSLATAAAEIAPALGDLPIIDQWSGLRPFATDGLPIVGELAGYEKVLVATAHYRNGILLAPKTAQIIADKIVDRVDSKYFDAFGAKRFYSAATIASFS